MMKVKKKNGLNFFGWRVNGIALKTFFGVAPYVLIRLIEFL
jgi:hypothetical protein